MGKYFDQFPKVLYDISGLRNGAYDVATNLFIRIGIINSIKENTQLYYPYLVQDGDTPEMIADKYYGDPQYNWIVLYMNDMMNPFYDWPLDYQRFTNYIVNKYGSIETSKTQIVRYEKWISRYDSGSGVTTLSKVAIDQTAYNAMAASTVTPYNLANGTTMTETVTRNIVYAWDDELAKNEAKRSIKLLKKEYLEQIKNNFEVTVGQAPAITPTVLTE